jgi:hypothetical protein
MKCSIEIKNEIVEGLFIKFFNIKFYENQLSEAHSVRDVP